MDFFVDINLNRLVAAEDSPVPPNLNNLTLLDLQSIRVMFVDTTTGEFVDRSTDILTVALGQTNQFPTSGTFTITFGGQTTSDIPYNATLAAVKAALEVLSTIGSGNVIVTGTPGKLYTIEFVGTLANSPQSEVTVDLDQLQPATAAIINEDVVGDATHNATQSIYFKQYPDSQSSSFTNTGTSPFAFEGGLSIVSTGLINRLLSSPSVQVKLQISSLASDSTKNTWTQSNVTLQDTIIPVAATSVLPPPPVPWNPLYFTADRLNFIKFNEDTNVFEKWIGGVKAGEL